MLKDIVEARAQGGHRLFLRFEDGLSGTLDFAQILRFEGVLEPLRDQAEFAKVEVSTELGTVCWPCGADLDPDVLYARLAGEPLPGVCEAQALSSTTSR